MTAQLVTVTGTYVLADDTPAAGTVLLTPVVVAGMSADVKRLVTRHSVAARLDSEGAFTVAVLASDDPDWMVTGPVLYEVAEYIAGARGKAYQVVIAGPGPVDLADLQPVDEPQTVAPYPVPGPKGDQGDKGDRGDQGPPLERLDDIGDVDAPPGTPTGNVLGTTAAGQWGPIGTDTIIAPIQAEIGDPHVVATHTDLVGYIGEIDERLAAIEHTQEPVAAERHLSVDKYSGSFTRVMVVPPSGPWPAKVDFALATVPGPGGAVFPDLAAISGGAAVWADFGGTLGRLNMADGTAVYGSALKEWIRRGTVATVRRDDSDPAHPNLVVDRIDQPAEAGSSLTLDALKDVAAPASTAAGMLLGTTGVGAWGPVTAPVRATRPNGTDRLVEAWDGAAWVPVHYDSGWRDVRGLLTATAVAQVETWSLVRLRRVGDMIHFQFQGNIGTGSIATTDLQMQTVTLPQGFWADIAGPIGVAGSWYDYYTHVVSTSPGLNAPTVMPPTQVPKWQNGSIGGALRFSTDQPLPTSLPGTLITTAP